MASAHIEINRSSPRIAAEFGYTVDLARQVAERVAKLKDVFDQLALDSDWAALAVALNLVGQTAEADAQAIYNLLGSVNTELASAPFFNQLIDRLG